MAKRVTLKAINDKLTRIGTTVSLAKGDGYFYFYFGEAADWLDRTVRVPTLGSLTLEQWLEGQCCKPENEREIRRFLFSLRNGGDTEEPGEKRNLPSDIVLRYPSNLAFADHVYDLDALNRAPRCIQRSEPLNGSPSAFDRSVILLNGLITNDKFCITRVSHRIVTPFEGIRRCDGTSYPVRS